MAKIGISYWGFCEEFEDSLESKTPDGHRYGRPILMKALASSGHKVYALQRKREKKPFPSLIYDEGGLPDLDLLFVEWRWPTYKNSGPAKFEPDLDRQTELLNYYHKQVRTKVVIWDCDYKLTEEDEIKWPNAIIACPSIEPRFLTRKRQRLMFWTDWKELFPLIQHSCEYGYIGNNYERDEAFNNYYSIPAKYLRDSGVQTTVHGNWLEISPERVHPATLIKEHKFVSFAPRLSFYESMKRLNTFACTTHITKPEYALRGFASPRYVENLACNVLALVPFEFLKNDILGKDWTVRAPLSIASNVYEISHSLPEKKKEWLDEQRHSLRSTGLFDVENVVKFFESII